MEMKFSYSAENMIDEIVAVVDDFKAVLCGYLCNEDDDNTLVLREHFDVGNDEKIVAVRYDEGNDCLYFLKINPRSEEHEWLDADKVDWRTMLTIMEYFQNGFPVDCKDDITYEVCPHCENEVGLVAEMKVQRCPECGRRICPCSLCDHDKVDCRCCPFENAFIFSIF